MSADSSRPDPSYEAGESLPLSPGEQAIWDELKSQLPNNFEQTVDDKKRPLPPEEEWGVPGAEV